MSKGSKAPQVNESQAEKALADVSSQKWDRYKDIYQPVERDFIRNSHRRDQFDVLESRGLADVAQASAGSFGDAIALGQGSINNINATARHMGGARGSASHEAHLQGRAMRDSAQLNALKIGNNMAADSQSGLAMAARASNTEALGRARAQSIKNEGQANAIQTVAGLGAGAYIDKNREKWALQMDKSMSERK